MGFFSLTAVPAGTQNELKARGDRQWDPSLGQAKTWIHIMSLAEGKTTTSVISTFEDFAGAYANNRPKYVVNSFKISAKGEFGTTRQGSLSMTIFDDDSFNNIADAYCIPEMSVRVQFGWSVDSNGAAAPAPYTDAALNDTGLDSVAIKGMFDLAAASAIYEGYQGRVVGWDVKYKADVSAWDLTLDLVGAADSISETGLDYSSADCQCKKEITGEAAEQAAESTDVFGVATIVEQTSEFEGVAIQLYEDPASLGSIASLKDAPNLLAEEIAYPGFSRDRDGTEDSDSWFTIAADLDARETFVSWGTVEAMFTRCSGQIFCEGAPSSYVIDSSGVELKVPTTDKPSLWFSADPRVCILPGGGLLFQDPVATGGVSVVGAFFDLFQGNSYGDEYPRPSGNCFTSPNSVKLVDIMVSTVHLNKRIKEFLNGDVKMMQGLNTLLKDINVAVGGVWELECIDVSLNKGVPGLVNLAVVDVNDSEGVPSFTFVTQAGSGFCRDVQIDFKPSDGMKNQALYGNQNNKNSSGTGGACSSRFMVYSMDGARNLGMKQNPDGSHPPTCNTDTCNPSNANEHPIDALSKKVVQTTVNGALNYLREQKRLGDVKRLSEKGEYCNSPILPIGLGVTVSGIGGFRWGQGVTCDRLPPDVANRLKWQVTAVEHSISPDDWTTTIKTVGRVIG